MPDPLQPEPTPTPTVGSMSVGQAAVAETLRGAGTIGVAVWFLWVALSGRMDQLGVRIDAVAAEVRDVRADVARVQVDVARMQGSTAPATLRP